jgi:hypothetical protein
MSKLQTCLSTTRPESPSAGDTLFETDTKRIITFSGTEWYVYEYDYTTAPIYTVSFLDTVGGTEKTCTTGPFGMGDEVEIVANPDEGYTFDSWSVLNSKTLESITVTENKFIMPGANVTAEATYIPPSFSVDIDTEITGGSVATDLTSAQEGTLVTLTISVDEGYSFTSISATGNSGALEITSVDESTKTFIMPGSSVSVSAGFTLIPAPTYSVTIDENITSGTITSDVSSGEEGDTVTLTLAADEGNVLESISATDENTNSVNLTFVNISTQTFVLPASNVTVTATFEAG